MPGFSFQSLFNEDPERQLVSGPGATSEWRIKPRSLMDEDADPRFHAFQQAWKRGAGIGDLFGPEPFKLQGTVSPSGGDNTRADVAKVQTLLGKAGYLDLGQDGPSGYANPNTDKAIRDFQKNNGLQVDGVLKPNGPTIAKLGGLLGGGGRPEPVHTNNIVQGEWDWQDKKQRPDFWPQPNIPRNSGNLLSILMGETPEPAAWPKPSTTFPAPPAPASGKDYDEVEIPGGRNPSIPPTIIRVPKDRRLWEQATTAEQTSTGSAPFGSADGADHWAAGNMAQALLGRSDYADAVTHFRGEIGRNRSEAMPYLASVHQTMNEKNPELAAKFAGEMQKAGLAETPKSENVGAVLSAPIPPTVTPGPVPPANPGETDIRIPAEPKPEPEKKPEGAAVPAASTTTPAPAPTASPDTAKPGTPAQPAPTTEDTTDRTPVQRDAEVLKDPANVPGYTKWLAEGAKKDPQWAEQHAKDVSREVYKANPQAAEEMVRQGEKAGVKVGLYADGHQAGKTADAIVRDAKGGWVSSGPDAGSKECVALVKATVPGLQGKSAKTDWRKGEDFKAVGDPPIKPGTALANGWDKNGKYPSKSTGNHALVYYGPDPNDSSKVIVVDQYAPKNGKAGQPATRHSWPAERLQGYSVIRVK